MPRKPTWCSEKTCWRVTKFWTQKYFQKGDAQETHVVQREDVLARDEVLDPEVLPERRARVVRDQEPALQCAALPELRHELLRADIGLRSPQPARQRPAQHGSARAVAALS